VCGRKFLFGVRLRILLIVWDLQSDDYSWANLNSMPVETSFPNELFRPPMGPFAAGFVVEHLKWQWVFWIMAIVCI
jgi:hypothetical protein